MLRTDLRAAIVSLTLCACANDTLSGLCDGRPSHDTDGDGHFSLGSCLQPADDCDDGNGTVHPGVAERCDGIDNDCSGTADDGFRVGEPCADGVGACRAEGVWECTSDGMSAACTAEPGAASPETCDSIDNDCDGVIDEDFGGGADCRAGIGACLAYGVMVCDPGTQELVCSATEGQPAAEACDGVDNDCNGVVDDDFPVGADCTVGVGACAARGSLVCRDDGAGTRCTAEPRPSANEICDGLDNDCDGRVDEGYAVGQDCVVGQGPCAATGTVVCTPTNPNPSCDAVPRPPQPEICNFVDDNCNGAIDESCTIPDEDTQRLAGIEADNLGGDTCANGPTLYAGVSPTLFIVEASLPGLVDYLRRHPERLGVQLPSGSRFDAPSCPTFADQGDARCLSCSHSTPYSGRVGVTRPGAGYRSSVEFGLYASSRYTCNSSDTVANPCFGNPRRDAFWLCWNGENNGLCTDSSTYLSTVWADDQAILSCVRDVETQRPSPWSIAIVSSLERDSSIDFGDQTGVAINDLLLEAEANGGYAKDLSSLTEFFYPIPGIVTDSGMQILIHTYRSAGTYTIRGSFYDRGMPGYRDLVATTFTTQSARDDASVCPMLYYMP